MFPVRLNVLDVLHVVDTIKLLRKLLDFDHAAWRLSKLDVCQKFVSFYFFWSWIRIDVLLESYYCRAASIDEIKLFPNFFAHSLVVLLNDQISFDGWQITVPILLLRLCVDGEFLL